MAVSGLEERVRVTNISIAELLPLYIAAELLDCSEEDARSGAWCCGVSGGRTPQVHQITNTLYRFSKPECVIIIVHSKPSANPKKTAALERAAPKNVSVCSRTSCLWRGNRPTDRPTDPALKIGPGRVHAILCRLRHCCCGVG